MVSLKPMPSGFRCPSGRHLTWIRCRAGTARIGAASLIVMTMRLAAPIRAVPALHRIHVRCRPDGQRNPEGIGFRDTMYSAYCAARRRHDQPVVAVRILQLHSSCRAPSVSWPWTSSFSGKHLKNTGQSAFFHRSTSREKGRVPRFPPVFTVRSIGWQRFGYKELRARRSLRGN